MIRMNLLPREEKAQFDVGMTLPKVGDMVLPVGMMFLTLAVISGMAIAQRMKIQALNSATAAVEQQARELAPQIARVNLLAQERAELDLRLGIIRKLEAHRTESVKLMDDVARCAPDNLWFTSVQVVNGLLTIEGATSSMLVVSDLMSRLESLPDFTNVKLQVAEQEKINDFDVVNFKISSEVISNPSAN
jgi:type IV pilus assembly protein PilN